MEQNVNIIVTTAILSHRLPISNNLLSNQSTLVGRVAIMFLVSLILVNILLLLLIKVYNKLTNGICTFSHHLVGKVVIVTGANKGIGYETVKDLAARGARVILACRDEGRGLEACRKIISATNNSDVHYRHLDLASLKSVRDFAKNIINTEKRLDILINNAGVFHVDFAKTEDDLLLMMQINHFGPFLLTNLLLPLLKNSAPSRIINVSSKAYNGGKIDFQNLNMEKETKDTYTTMATYRNSKLCNVLMTVELDRILRGTGVTANCLHPGVVYTDLISEMDWPILKYISPVVKFFCKNIWEGAQTSIYLAVSPEVQTVSGGYFADCRQLSTTKLAQDTDLARKLWEESARLVKL